MVFSYASEVELWYRVPPFGFPVYFFVRALLDKHILLYYTQLPLKKDICFFCQTSPQSTLLKEQPASMVPATEASRLQREKKMWENKYVVRLKVYIYLNAHTFVGIFGTHSVLFY